jgi:pyruvate/2-oxoglutarate dehydrogenase complex dihydrolipoamide dehydrogenase (E3) component
VDAIDHRYAQRLHEAGIEHLAARGRFVATDTIALDDGRQLKAPHIVIATGARPRTLALPGFDLGMVSDDMFTLQRRRATRCARPCARPCADRRVAEHQRRRSPRRG